MDGVLPTIGFWGHAAVAFAYAALAIWLFHKYGTRNRQQIWLICSMAVTSLWGVAAIVSGALSLPALWAESARNLAWLGFMFFLLKSGEGREQPRTINMIYVVLLVILLLQPMIDAVGAMFGFGSFNANIVMQSAMTMRMIFAVGALVVVHNLYTVSAPEARWGISLPMAALAAMWTYDLNLYTIGYITAGPSDELIETRGFVTALLAPVFVMAARRNSNWGFRLSRSVAFQSVSLVAIAVYMLGMVILATALEIVGGTYVRLAQITLIFGMSLAALLVLPSGRFKSWLNVIIAKNFFQHRYDYRSEWMRFADTIGFPSKEAAPFYERVIKSLADIFDSPGGLLLVPDEEGRLTLQARWNWATANVPAHCVTSMTMPFFETTGHIVSMDQVRAGTDDRSDPRAIPQWLYDETQAWAVVPLVHFGKLAGLVILARPRLPRALDWEDLDMLRVVGRQLASYLAEAASQQALAESQQFEQFNRRFAFVAHDIKNLVSQLSILARNAERHAEKPEFRVDMIDTLRSSVDKMNELLARLSQHNKSRQSAPIIFDIGEAVMKAVHDKRLIYPIDAELKPGMFATADPARVETIIGHLVQNAIEASEDGAPIRISCTIQDKDIAIHISDQGVGMSEMFISKMLFKPFESTKEGGFGIGAYEAKALAMSMGGQLRVTSKPGKGTIFTLLLPKATEIKPPVNMDEAA
ncbi:PEP-CTERM system histidine kinase PrsK [Sphingorhabdus sp. IMCC26285]|uniref:histidine kinase n=1 Tax=Sphingorhabdus profundilacus TaxID=2509718 RepID=A0A6I4LXW6_9SPHN|nr:XrtA/PEP-CTERM system histidine kinase PrsK [Sphingorhabdus profundilacus]MVZ96880.1 PEP-CTERM system histidine kinase PrsK [Sphingorhabdus profundilacus]